MANSSNLSKPINVDEVRATEDSSFWPAVTRLGSDWYVAWSTRVGVYARALQRTGCPQG
jgi:hypothetical protein